MSHRNLLLCVLVPLLHWSLPVNGQDGPDKEDTVEAVEEKGEVIWHSTLDDAIKEASEANRPIFVIVGAEWCVFCKQLEQELTGAPSKRIADRWVLAKIDADDRVSDAREMRANGLPSLRLLSKDGVIGSSRDGYMATADLMSWLDESYAAVKSNVPKMLEIDPAEFTDEQVAELMSFVSTRDVTARRIIIDRLSKIPDRCVFKTIELLESNRLANQLSALELLRRWNAPVQGIDPWVPGSVDEKTIQQLLDWIKQSYPDALLDV
ncbi:MAG: thioredoxin family protein [Planctomycetales bacterium]|nr:thioredoxin family protein [Planctomycetales bacterium]